MNGDETKVDGVRWSDLPDCGDRRGWPWQPRNESDVDFDVAAAIKLDGADVAPILVVTPSFDQGDFIEQTIRSVLLQQYPRLTYHVVDGGSTDQTVSIIEKYRPWIDQIIIEPDDGQSDAICKGIGQRADGWFNWINSDDWLAPGILWQVAAHANAGLVAASIEVLGDGKPYLIENERLDAATMLLDGRYSFAQPGAWLRLDQLHRCGGIDRRLHYGFDWDLMIRYLADKPTIKYLDRIGAYFRVHGQSKTSLETQKSDDANRFHQEQDVIRDKLEQQLTPSLVQASKIGRRRRLWNQTLVKHLDQLDSSPVQSCVVLMREMLGDPKAKMTSRAWMSMLRLMSRYVRTKESIGKR